MSNGLAAIVLVPLISGVVFLFLPRKSSLLVRILTLLCTLLCLAESVRIFTAGAEDFAWRIVDIGNITLQMLLTATPFGTLVLMVACGFALLTTVYSFKSATRITRVNEYFGGILLVLGSSAGILLSNHLLMLLIFWEIVTASLYLLVATGGKNSNFAATKSFAMIGASDAALLLGIMLTWVSSGTFIISDVKLETVSPGTIAAFLLLLTAAITKAGALPLHTWLPTSSESAPVSVMALLPAAIDKLLGIYLLVVIVLKMFVIKSEALNIVLTVIGSATIIIAVMVAMVQHNLKKLLSYHAVSQVGYMILGIASGTPVGIIGGVFHMFNNAIYKSCLFLCAGAVEQAAGTSELDKLGGLGKKMPFTFYACLIAALSISGVPPFNGFASKWMIYQGLIEMGNTQTGAAATLWPVWLVAAMFGSALTLASFVKVLHSVFLSRTRDDLKNVREVSAAQIAPMGILALLCVFLGVFYWPAVNKLLVPALNLPHAIVFVGTWDSLLATALLAAGIFLGLLILAVGLSLRKARAVPTWSCGETQQNEQMVIPGTHFYKTVSSMGGLRQLYNAQENGHFDLYNQSGKCGLALTAFLRWLHNGILPMYLTWVTLGLLIILFVVCKIW